MMMTNQRSPAELPFETPSELQVQCWARGIRSWLPYVSKYASAASRHST